MASGGRDGRSAVAAVELLGDAGDLREGRRALPGRQPLPRQAGRGAGEPGLADELFEVGGREGVELDETNPENRFGREWIAKVSDLTDEAVAAKKPLIISATGKFFSNGLDLEWLLANGDRLPPSRELAAELGISRHTVTTVYGRLVAEGYLEGRAGGGTHVSFAAESERRRRRSAALRPL